MVYLMAGRSIVVTATNSPPPPSTHLWDPHWLPVAGAKLQVVSKLVGDILRSQGGQPCGLLLPLALGTWGESVVPDSTVGQWDPMKVVPKVVQLPQEVGPPAGHGGL